jgi:hypothetical protein
LPTSRLGGYLGLLDLRCRYWHFKLSPSSPHLHRSTFSIYSGGLTYHSSGRLRRGLAQALGNRRISTYTTRMPLRSASCSCGQLRLTVSEEPIRVSICHCVACQRRAGSVFGAQARLSRHAVQVSGESPAYVRIGDEGGRTTFHFCPKCGATVHYPSEGHEEHIAVPVARSSNRAFLRHRYRCMKNACIPGLVCFLQWSTWRNAATLA